jgi:hypothetical protein
MHRIDSSTATPDGRFTEGNPTIPVPATTVTADWLNAMQEEAIAILVAAEIAPDKANNAQILAAILKLIADKSPGIATSEKNGIGRPDGITITIDASGKYTATTRPFILGEFYYFRHPSLRTGFAPCQGSILANAVTQYPEIWAYLQTAEGQLLLKTEAEWQAMSTATWATLADGTKVGWNGIGGVPYYVQDLATGTLRLPDLRGMYAEAAGFDSLGVGGVHGDMMRKIVGRIGADAQNLKWIQQHVSGAFKMLNTPSIGSGNVLASYYGDYSVDFDSSRVVPAAAVNKPRAWGALACCYLGQPAS